MSRDAWAPHSSRTSTRPCSSVWRTACRSPTARRRVEAVAAGFGSPDVLNEAQYVDDMAGGIDMALDIIYVMLALAIVIAAMGIANTLSLSIHERQRELGLLRAVGQDRAQTRAMVRWESVIVAVFGTVGGVALGTFLGWGVMQGVAGAGPTPLEAFAVPSRSSPSCSSSVRSRACSPASARHGELPASTSSLRSVQIDV